MRPIISIALLLVASCANDKSSNAERWKELHWLCTGTTGQCQCLGLDIELPVGRTPGACNDLPCCVAEPVTEVLNPVSGNTAEVDGWSCDCRATATCEVERGEVRVDTCPP